MVIIIEIVILDIVIIFKLLFTQQTDNININNTYYLVTNISPLKVWKTCI